MDPAQIAQQMLRLAVVFILLSLNCLNMASLLPLAIRMRWRAISMMTLAISIKGLVTEAIASKIRIYD